MVYLSGPTRLSVTGGGRLPDYLTVRETAEILGYHVGSVCRLIRGGKLRADKKGNMWLIYREAVEDFQKSMGGKAKRGRPSA